MYGAVAPHDLSGYLDTELAADLLEMAKAYPVRVRVPARPRRPDEGYTGAVLATVIIEDKDGAHQVMMKACPARAWESSQYLRAWEDRPEFANRHLIRLRSTPGPWPMANGGLILFQDLAGDGGDCVPLGWTITEVDEQAIAELPQTAWTDSVNQDGTVPIMRRSLN